MIGSVAGRKRHPGRAEVLGVPDAVGADRDLADGAAGPAVRDRTRLRVEGGALVLVVCVVRDDGGRVRAAGEQRAEAAGSRVLPARADVLREVDGGGRRVERDAAAVALLDDTPRVRGEALDHAVVLQAGDDEALARRMRGDEVRLGDREAIVAGDEADLARGVVGAEDAAVADRPEPRAAVRVPDVVDVGVRADTDHRRRARRAEGEVPAGEPDLADGDRAVVVRVGDPGRVVRVDERACDRHPVRIARIDGDRDVVVALVGEHVRDAGDRDGRLGGGVPARVDLVERGQLLRRVVDPVAVVQNVDLRRRLGGGERAHPVVGAGRRDPGEGAAVRAHPEAVRVAADDPHPQPGREASAGRRPEHVHAGVAEAVERRCRDLGPVDAGAGRSRPLEQADRGGGDDGRAGRLDRQPVDAPAGEVGRLDRPRIVGNARGGTGGGEDADAAERVPGPRLRSRRLLAGADEHEVVVLVAAQVEADENGAAGVPARRAGHARDVGGGEAADRAPDGAAVLRVPDAAVRGGGVDALPVVADRERADATRDARPVRRLASEDHARAERQPEVREVVGRRAERRRSAAGAAPPGGPGQGPAGRERLLMRERPPAVVDEVAPAERVVLALSAGISDVGPLVDAHREPPGCSGTTRTHPSRNAAGVSGSSAVCVAARIASVRHVAGVSRQRNAWFVP